MSKKAAAAVIGLTALGVVGLALLSKAKAQSTSVQVQLYSNPIPTILAVDGVEVETPAKINLSPGLHTFAAVPKSPDLLVTYGFDKWQNNGVLVSYDSTAKINITGPCLITAQYMMIEATVNSPASLPGVENVPNTPNLANPNLNMVFET